MTKKELMKQFDVSTNTFDKAADACGIERANGVTKDYDERECSMILAYLQRNYNPENRPSQLVEKVVDLQKIDTKATLALRAMESYKTAVEAQNQLVAMLQEENAQLKARLDEDETWYSVVKWYAHNGDNITLKEAQSVGKRMHHLSRDMGYDVRRVVDAHGRFPTVGSYHKDVWEAFTNEMNPALLE
jgi:hypothetical protein